MGQQRVIWLALGIAAAIGLGLALWASKGPSRSSSPGDTASVQQQVQVEVTGGSGEPRASGGTGDTGRIKEGVEYVIRDASGKIKEQEAVGGQ